MKREEEEKRGKYSRVVSFRMDARGQFVCLFVERETWST